MRFYGPDECYGLDDSGECPNCGEHLDSGMCNCDDDEIDEAADNLAQQGLYPK